MKITDELIACYVEGKVTAEERVYIRKYLCEHPEEFEQILLLMDNYGADYLVEDSGISNNYCVSMDDASVLNNYSSSLTCPKGRSSIETGGFLERLGRISDELDIM